MNRVDGKGGEIRTTYAIRITHDAIRDMPSVARRILAAFGELLLLVNSKDIENSK